MHTWIAGNPQTGKTTMLMHYAREAMHSGTGLVFIDTHGDAIDTLLAHVPKRRVRNVLLIDPTAPRRPVRWNMLHDVPKEARPLYATITRDTIKAIANYTTATPVLDRVLYNTIAALLWSGDASLTDIEPMLTDKAFRDSVLEKVRDEYLLRKWDYWTKKNKRDYDALIASSENKGGEFAEDPRVRSFLSGPSTFNLRQLLSGEHIVLLRLPQGQLGVSRAASLASLFLAHVLAVIQSRHLPMLHGELSLFLDDFHLLDTPILRQLLSSGSRNGISLFLANQYLAQLSPDLLYAVVGNTHRRIMFQMGIEDSERIHRTLPTDNNKPKVHELSGHSCLILEHGEFSTGAGPVLPRGNQRIRRSVMAQSRRQYGF